MKALQKLTYAIIAALALILVSCEPLEKVSDIPEIGFKSLEGPYIVQASDTTITSFGAFLTFSFRDGNSDFGVDLASAPHDTNLILNPFHKVDGIYDSINAALYGRRYQVKKEEKMGQPDQPVKGEIKVLITYFVKPPFDTLRYDFYITDRAGNKSNVVSSSDISF